MFNILIITHGELCEELDSAVRFILGDKMLREIFTVSIDKDTRDFDTYASRISNFITEERKTIDPVIKVVIIGEICKPIAILLICLVGLHLISALLS